MQISGAAAVQLDLFFAASHSMEPGANAVWAACGVTYSPPPKLYRGGSPGCRRRAGRPCWPEQERWGYLPPTTVLLIAPRQTLVPISWRSGSKRLVRTSRRSRKRLKWRASTLSRIATCRLDGLHSVFSSPGAQPTIAASYLLNARIYCYWRERTSGTKGRVRQSNRQAGSEIRRAAARGTIMSAGSACSGSICGASSTGCTPSPRR